MALGERSELDFTSENCKILETLLSIIGNVTCYNENAALQVLEKPKLSVLSTKNDSF